jgi:hypothetical protein
MNPDNSHNFFLTQAERTLQRGVPRAVPEDDKAFELGRALLGMERDCEH